jgi:hypothetical protein
MLSNSIVTDDDLLALGDRRAKAARDWLIAHEVSTDRIFLLPSKLGGVEGQSDGGGKINASRAEFSLK